MASRLYAAADEYARAANDSRHTVSRLKRISNLAVGDSLLRCGESSIKYLIAVSSWSKIRHVWDFEGLSSKCVFHVLKA